MKTKRSLLTSVLCVLMLVFSVFAFTACGDCEHEWSEWSVSSPSTCSTQGTKQRKCSKCDEVQTENIDIADHEYDVENLVWTWNGYESATATLSCITDSTHTRQINANITDEVTKSATCMETGEKIYTATVNIDGVAYIDKKIEIITNDAHTYNSESITWHWDEIDFEGDNAFVPITLVCTEAETHTYELWFMVISINEISPATCKSEGICQCTAQGVVNDVVYRDTETVILPALNHTIVTDAAVASTCEKTGLTEGSHCSVCNEVLVAQQETAKANHTEVKIDAVAATCSAEGATEGVKCSVCNIVLVAPQPTNKISHTEEIIPAVDATCEKAGLTEGKKCSVCGEVLLAQTETELADHTEEIVPAVDATCSENGLTEGKKCSVCNKTLVAQQPTDKLAHTETALLGVAPSCSEEGLTEGKKCSVCGTVTVKQEPIDKLPHTEEIVVGTAPTCSATGLSDGKKCSVCKETLVAQTILPKIACDYESVVTAPTCEAQGYTTHTCSYCKDSFVDTYVDELGHNWGAWEVSGSYTIRNCTNECNCGKYQRISSISATYNGIRLLTGETVWKDDVAVTATLTDGTIISITDFSLENDEMTVDGANYVTVNFQTLSTTFSVPAIYNNLPGTTSASEFTYEVDGDAITITGFIGSSTEIIIPAHIDRVPVRYIGESAFNGQENIKSVVIPDSIFNVGANAFNNCKRMSSLTLGKGLTFLDIGAFANCISLTTVDIPANVLTLESPYWSDDYGVFENCTALTKVAIGNNENGISETVIGKRAFQNCSLLNELTIGNNVKVIGESSFNGCNSLTTLTIGSGVETISAYAFNNCENLKTVTIPNSVTTIGSHAFNNCKRMTILTLGNGLTFLDIGAFANCISLKTVDIPESVLTMESPYWSEDFGVFENCTGLTKVTIGNETSAVAETVIGKRAFQNCTNLSEVFIGNKVKIIGENAFNGCASLVTLTIGTGVENISAYAFNNCESLIAVDIPDSVVTIGSHAFNNCKRMTSLTFGSGLTYLDIGAFANCSKLTFITIPVNVLTLESPYWSDEFGVFENCTGLTKVIIGNDTVDIAETVIGKRAFKNCTSLVELYIGNKVKVIGESSFEGCTALTTLTIGNGVQEIQAFAFNNCEVLASVQIPDSVKTIGSHAFNNCKKMKVLTLGKGLTYLDIGAFANCISLTSLNIPANVLTLESPYWSDDFGVFENCTGLTKVIIGDDTVDIAETVIGKRAFKNCNSLIELFIGNKVKIVGESSFEGCTALTTLTIGSGVQEIQAYAFNNCSAITSVVIPNSVLTIGSHAFNNCKRMAALSLGKGLTYLDIGAFANCISLTSLNIPANVLTLESPYWSDDFGVFENCTGLVKVIIGDDTVDIPETTIGERAFKGCTALEEVYIGSNVKTIEENAFEGCTSLVNFNIGTGVQRIGAYALQNCTSLKSVAIPANVQVIGAGLFTNCSSLEEVIIEKGVLREVGNDVFNGCSSFDRMYYTGTASDWVLVAVSEDNSYPLNVSPYYYSSSSPSGKGNYWHYNSNGEIKIWNVSETSFKAEEYSEKFANSTFGSSDTSYSSQFLSQLEGDSLFQARILIWEALHIATDSSWESKAISKKDVYKMVIYDLLVGEADAQVNPLAGMDAACNSYVYDFAKFLLGKDSLTKAELDQLKNLSPLDYDYIEMVDKYFEGIDVLKEVFEMSTNLYDALYVAAQYKALSDMDTNFYLVLMEISNDSSLPWDLRNAASECAGCYRTATDALLKKIVVQEFASSTMEVLWKDFQDEAWKAVLGSVFPQVELVTLTAKGVMFLADAGFNLDACNEAYYQLEAAVGLENALRNVIKNTLPDYLRYNYKDKSEYYMYAIDMYQTSVLLGFDYSNNLLREHSKSIDVNAEEKQAYENMMAQISGMKQEKATLYNNFESVIEQLYVVYYS